MHDHPLAVPLLQTIGNASGYIYRFFVLGFANKVLNARSESKLAVRMNFYV